MTVTRRTAWVLPVLALVLLGLSLFVPPGPPDYVLEGEEPPPVRAPSPGSPWDCELLARSLRAQVASNGRLDWPLMVDDGDATCRWPRHGIALTTVTPEDFEAEACGPKDRQGRCTEHGYLAHVQLDRPRYAVLPLRAEVDGGHAFDWVGGAGWRCQYVNLIVRWQLIGCGTTWVS